MDNSNNAISLFTSWRVAAPLLSTKTNVTLGGSDAKLSQVIYQLPINYEVSIVSTILYDLSENDIVLSAILFNLTEYVVSLI